MCCVFGARSKPTVSLQLSGMLSAGLKFATSYTAEKSIHYIIVLSVGIEIYRSAALRIHQSADVSSAHATVHCACQANAIPIHHQMSCYRPCKLLQSPNTLIKGACAQKTHLR